MQLTVALAGEEAAGLQTLKLLSGRGHRVAAVFSNSVGAGRGATVASIAADLEIPLRPAGEVRDPALAGVLDSMGVELLLNVHSLHIIDAEVLEAPSLGAYNLHPGPLPECAGLNAPSWALYHGAERHGVTLHRMTPGVDEGPIAFDERFAVGEDDTALVLATQCVRRGLPLIKKLLEHIERGDPVPGQAQDTDRRRWFGAGPPEGGHLSWDQPARQVGNFVRACDYGPFASPWGFPRCSAEGGEVAVAAAAPLPEPADAEPGTVAPAEGGAMLVAAADDWVRVDRVEVGGRQVPAGEVLRPGERLRAAAKVEGVD